MLWLKSRSSEVWLERRTHYTRSCAVMSMVCPPLLASVCLDHMHTHPLGPSLHPPALLPFFTGNA